MNLIQTFEQNMMTQKTLPDIRPGQTVKIHQRVKEGNKTRVQVFEGIVIARKHGRGPNATITIRKISNGIGVERVFPIHLPTIEKFEIVRASKVRQAKLYYLRHKTARETRKKTKLLEIKIKPTSVSKRGEVLKNTLK